MYIWIIINLKSFMMKALYTLVTLLIMTSIYSQNFEEIENYRLTDYSKVLNTTKIDYNKSFEISLVKDGEPLVKLMDLSKDDLDSFLDTKIEVLENPKLNNIKKVIKVSFEFLEHCIKFETQYFLVTDENSLIKLPSLRYRQCEHENERIEYIFPNQEFGKENTIIQSLSFLNEENRTKNIEIEKLIVWEEQAVAYTINLSSI